MSKIKICGIRRLADTEYVNNAMPDYVGFVFAKSKRQVDMDTAQLLKRKIDSKIKTVGVFVNAPIPFIKEIANKNIIDVIQLHGNEDIVYIKEVKELTNLPIIKAVDFNSNTELNMYATKDIDFLLLDNGKGGTGKSFDWKRIHNINKPYFLAGGIEKENISDALKLKPYCIDVSSGVETDGVKDRDKIEYIVNEVRRK